MVIDYSKHDGATRLSKNFKLREFRCKCGCGKALVDEWLVEILQQIRDHFGKSVNINSGCRCATLNARVGGDPNSSHMQGMAADITVTGVKPAEVAKYAESIGVRRIGLYDAGFVHIGSGTKKLFWKNKNSNRVDTFGGFEAYTLTMEPLSRGMKNERVRAVQQLLLDYGIDADGSFGPATENAVECFQEENGLPATGVVDRETMKRLLGLEGG
jgi:hypothetical protein